jgi:hypothetical protein
LQTDNDTVLASLKIPSKIRLMRQTKHSVGKRSPNMKRVSQKYSSVKPQLINFDI